MQSLHDPVFIAKVVDFIVFVGAIIWVFNRYGKVALVAHQQAQNKAVADAIVRRDAAEQSVSIARSAIEKAKADAVRMIEVSQAQAARLLLDERAAASEHAQRILAHAAGELERERYRVRRELLEQTVERAHQEAQALARRELDPNRQAQLVEQLMGTLERSHA